MKYLKRPKDASAEICEYKNKDENCCLNILND